MVDLATTVPTVYFPEALETLETERTILTAETAAFEEFLGIAESVTPASPTGHGAFFAQSSTDGTDPFRTLRQGYESTVMETAHYSTEYDEPYEEHVRAEYGPDIATLLTSGHVFERHHKQAVMAATEEVIEQRRSLLDALEKEQTSIKRHRKPVQSIIDAIDRFDAAAITSDSPELPDGYRRRMDVLQSRCHDLIESRQSEIVDDRRALSLSINAPDVPTYLYDDLPVTYPVIDPLTTALGFVAEITAAVTAEEPITSCD